MQKSPVHIVKDSSLSSKVAMFNNQAQQHKNAQLLNPFSNADGRSSPKPTFSKDEYGKPLAGSLTEMRGQKANIHVMKEMLELCHIINTEGYKVNDEPNMRVIPFGELFNIYNYISDKVVGILLRARKYKLVDFEGEMLFQRRDDDVPVFLLKPIADIRKELDDKIEEIKRAASPAPQSTSVMLDKAAHQQKLKDLSIPSSLRNSKSRSQSPIVHSKLISPAPTPAPTPSASTMLPSAASTGAGVETLGISTLATASPPPSATMTPSAAAPPPEKIQAAIVEAVKKLEQVKENIAQFDEPSIMITPAATPASAPAKIVPVSAPVPAPSAPTAVPVAPEPVVVVKSTEDQLVGTLAKNDIIITPNVDPTPATAVPAVVPVPTPSDAGDSVIKSDVNNNTEAIVTGVPTEDEASTISSPNNMPTIIIEASAVYVRIVPNAADTSSVPSTAVEGEAAADDVIANEASIA